MGEPFPPAESTIPQGSSKIEKKEIIKGGFSLHKGESMKYRIEPWKDDSTLQVFKPESKIDLSGRGLKTLLEQDIRNLHQVVELDLSDNPLSPLALEDLRLHCLKKLDLSGCGLTELPCDLLMCKQLEELNLSNNPFDSHKSGYFWHLILKNSLHLKKLDLSGCGLTARLFEWGFFSSRLTEFSLDLGEGNQLEELNVSNNPLDSRSVFYGYRIFHYLPNLKKLDMSGCGLTELPRDSDECEELEELNLSNNPLDSEVSYPVSCALPHLKKLDLSGCGLTEFPHALQNCWSLQELNLSNNFIEHSDLLEKLNSETKASVPSWYKSCMKPLVKPVSVFSNAQLPNLIKVAFEDAVYIKREGAWTVERREDASSTSNSESSTKLVESQSKKIFDPSTDEMRSSNHEEYDRDQERYRRNNYFCWFGDHLANESDEMINREFFQMKKIKKLTIENYHSILFSLKSAVCVLESYNVGHNFGQNVTVTCRRCLKIVNNHLLWIEATLYHPLLKRPSLLLESINYLKKGILLLHCLMRQTYVEKSDRKQSNRKAFEVSSRKNFRTAFEKGSEALLRESSLAGDRILVSKLRIISKILESFSKPEVAALGCLQLLQELHDLHEIQERFCIPNMEISSDTHVTSVLRINKIMFKFVGKFLKPPPTAEEWPATIQFDGKIHNPLTDDRFFELKLLDVFSPQEVEILQSVISRPGSQDRCENDTKDGVPVISSYGQTVVKSITVDKQGGCFSVPVASAFLVFPPDAVQGKVTLTCSRVKHKECEVKPRDGETFVSRILKIEPEDMVFQKPVTVLLSHSVYEDQDFVDFYELVAINLNPGERQELKTERISCVEDVPKEIRDPKILSDDLPFAKATIYETCILVATTRIRAHQILVPTNKSLLFSKKYGGNKEVKITFPADVTKKILCLTVQLFPADDVLSSGVYLDDNLVCAPGIKVSGQTDPFLKPVDVELTYRHNDVANIEDNFLSVGKKIRFTTDYGLLLRNQKQIGLTSNWVKLNESNEVYIERLRKDQIKFSFSVEHFCKLLLVVKKSADAQLNVEMRSSNVSHGHTAIVLAVHETGSSPERIHAVLAPVTARKDIKDKWKVDGVRFGHRVKCGEPIFFCVPLRDSLENYHLALKDHTMWFDPEMEFELANNVKDSVDLRGRFMHFLNNRPCNATGDNHNTQRDCRAKAPIHISDTKLSQATTERHDELSLDNESQHGEGNTASQRELCENNVNIQRSQVLADVMYRCEAFERMVETAAQEKLKIKTAFVTEPKGGKATEIVNIAGPLTITVLGLSCGITIAMGVTTFGIASFVGAAVAGVTLAVTNADKHFKKSQAKVVDEIKKANVPYYLKCIVKEVAKELSYMFEYQLFQLKDEREVETLANCAVDLMLDLKKKDKFDRNTLLKKVLQDGEITRKKLMTRNEDKWYVPDVFRKPGLRRVDIGTDRGELKYFVKQEGACDTQTYGYRGQFLEVNNHRVRSEEDTMEVDTETPKFEELCEECSDYRENCSDGTYFVESSIDCEYRKQCQEALFYRPLHVLVRCPKVLASFIENHETQPSLADFLNTVTGFHDDNDLHPIYRPHSPGIVPHLSKADLSRADFSRSNFTNVSLEKCDFTKCVMLFAELQGAKMSGSKFVDTLISNSNLAKIHADGCQWTKTSVLYSCVDSACLDSVEPSVGGNCWDGTNLCDAITRKKRPFGYNGRHQVMEDMPNRKRSCRVSTYC